MNFNENWRMASIRLKDTCVSKIGADVGISNNSVRRIESQGAV